MLALAKQSRPNQVKSLGFLKSEFSSPLRAFCTKSKGFRPSIKVCGIGGGGGNAVNTLVSKNIPGIEYVVCNTDIQALSQSKTKNRIILGKNLTKGLGTGSDTMQGLRAAEESAEALLAEFNGASMVFLAASLGGGTGTGAAPFIGRLLRSKGILTVAVVTYPFKRDGAVRRRIAKLGLKDLRSSVDAIIVVPNDSIPKAAPKEASYAEALAVGDEVLYHAVRSVSDITQKTGSVNLDFGDVRSVLSDKGAAFIAAGEGENGLEAAKAIVHNPLQEHANLRKAKDVIISISGGPKLSLKETESAVNYLHTELPSYANVIFGAQVDPDLNDRIRVSIIATGLDSFEEDYL
jgi:cell division protein FtsZ